MSDITDIYTNKKRMDKSYLRNHRKELSSQRSMESISLVEEQLPAATFKTASFVGQSSQAHWPTSELEPENTYI